MKLKSILKILLSFFLLGGISGFLIVIVSFRMSESPEYEEFAENNPLIGTLIDVITSTPEEVRKLRETEYPDHDPGHQEFYYRQLKEDERKGYREMLEGIRNRRTDFYMTIADPVQIDRIASALYNDHPELYWIHNKEKSFTTSYDHATYSKFSPGYTYTQQQMQEIDSRIEAAFREVCSLLPENPSDYDMVKTVYEYLIDHTEYVDSENDQSIAGVFWKKEAVCAGYARAAMYLLERLNIPCIFVEGDSLQEEGRHAWNIVTIDGEYYYMDVTNGDQPDFLVGEASQLLEHKTTVLDYLCPYPEEYEKLYQASPDFEIPACTSHAMNFYVLNGSVIDPYSWQAVYDFCCMRIDNGAAVLRFRLETDEDFDQASDDWLQDDNSRPVSQYYMQRNGLEYVEYYCGALDTFHTIYFIF